ncbi:MAG: aminotransferase class I/II-fold pyridoxal phosphate-dependent enzyme [Acidobacteriota bacterium]
MSRSRDHLDTRVVHAGEAANRVAGSAITPVFQSTVYEIPAGREDQELTYIRYNNLPNHQVLADKLADLENAEAALVTSSGMAAISAALLSVLSQGDHLLACGGLYGGTHQFVHRFLPRYGVEVSVIDVEDPASWSGALRPNSRAIYVETVSNPTLAVPPLDEVGRFAGKHGLAAMTDNTFATPINFRPAEHGFDLSLHSATKYLNGHSDLVAGAIIGRRERVEACADLIHLLGGCLDPHACYLLQRGLKTLGVRMERHHQTALALAQRLEPHPAVAKVLYPGLASHPHHQRASRLLDGFGGMLAVELEGGTEAAHRWLTRTRLATHAPSLGGIETLIVSPARSSHRSLSSEERRQAGISDGLVRISTGIEAADDLLADLEAALAE